MGYMRHCLNLFSLVTLLVNELDYLVYQLWAAAKLEDPYRFYYSHKIVLSKLTRTHTNTTLAESHFNNPDLIHPITQNHLEHEFLPNS